MTALGRKRPFVHPPILVEAYRVGVLPRMDVTIANIAPRRAFLLVLCLDRCEAVAIRQLRMLIVSEEAKSVPREDRTLHRSVCWAKRLKTVPLLHVFGDFESP